VVDLPRLRWWLIRHLFVLPFRPRRSARLYRSIWTDAGSALVVTTRSIGSELGPAIKAAVGVDAPVRVAMRYGSPTIAAGLDELTGAGCERVLVLPLYPQYSTTTTASTMDAVARAAARRSASLELRAVSDYHDHPHYLSALAASIRDLWRTGGPANRLLMSFHGIPRRIADAGDPYPRQCGTTAKALAERLDLGIGCWHMAYQSRFGREPWLQPSLDHRLESWGRRGERGVDVICPGFAADCLETLEEVAVAGRRRFETAGGRDFRYVPALNDRPDHIAALAAIVADHTRDWIGDGPDQNTSSR
jgi:ferrochelatase